MMAEDSRPLRDLQDWYAVGYGPSRSDLGNNMPDPWRILEALSARQGAAGGGAAGVSAGTRMSPVEQGILAGVKLLPTVLGLAGLGR